MASEESGVVRYRPERSYAGSKKTRKEILNAATDVFGEMGFDGATTRIIASRAGVTTPVLQYYFGSKEGIFNECTQEIVDFCLNRYDPIIADIEQAVLVNDKESAHDSVCALMEKIVETIFSEISSPGTANLITKIQTTNTPDRSRKIFSVLESKLHSAVFLTIRLLSDPSVTYEEIALRTHYTLGLALPFQFMRNAFLPFGQYYTADDEKLIVLKFSVRTHCSTLLNSYKS